jgi:hypothetical protein
MALRHAAVSLGAISARINLRAHPEPVVLNGSLPKSISLGRVSLGVEFEMAAASG